MHFLIETGDLYTFGRGSYGCLGHGNSEDKLEPCLVQALKDHTIVDVALGTSDAHTLCVTDVGLVFAFGDGDYGVSIQIDLAVHYRYYDVVLIQMFSFFSTTEIGKWIMCRLCITNTNRWSTNDISCIYRQSI